MKKKSVLIVEDDPDLRELVADEFESSGWDVDEAENGLVASEMVLQKDYFCVFSDMKMPKGDGRFLAKKVTEMTADKPLMFICSGYSELSEQEALELGIKKIFNKPMVMSEVLEQIEEFFE